MITVKTPEQIEKMREAGKIVAEVLEEMGKHIKPGISTLELDKIAREYIISRGAKPSFLHYHGFPASICASIDDVVVHGIPKKNLVLQEGQIVGIDVGAVKNGYHGDAARTFLVGNVSEEKKKLVQVTEECFYEAIKGLKEGSRLGDIGARVQHHAEKHGYSVVRIMVGHGIGREMHEDPDVPNYGTEGTGIKLKAGMTLAIEPMINMGSYELKLNGWDARTIDGLPSAHYENTVLICSDGVEILTKI
ncbi:MAG: type I methionyl aminopeptidase [Clostridia bacterium]|nr:type I methionyl aminopeptidase [Clostridia bacterium]